MACPCSRQVRSRRKTCCSPRPVEVAASGRWRRPVPGAPCARPCPLSTRARHAAVGQRRGRHRRPADRTGADVAVERALVLLDQQQVVPARRQHLRAQRRLAEQARRRSAPGRASRCAPAAPGPPSVPPPPCPARPSIGSWARTTPASWQKALKAWTGSRRGRKAQPSALRFAVDGHALAARSASSPGRRRGAKQALSRRRQGVAVEVAEQALQRRLAGRAPVGKAERGQQRRRLGAPPTRRSPAPSGGWPGAPPPPGPGSPARDRRRWRRGADRAPGRRRRPDCGRDGQRGEDWRRLHRGLLCGG